VKSLFSRMRFAGHHPNVTITEDFETALRSSATA
jgi:hypothetical protein